MGRKSTYTSKVGQSVCSMLSEGKSLKATCKKLKLSYTMVYKWQENEPHFKELSARSKREGYDAIGDDCIDIADNKLLDPADKRIMIDTRLRLLGKWAPKKYGDRTILAGDVDAPLEVNLNANERAARIAHLLKKAVDTTDGE